MSETRNAVTKRGSLQLGLLAPLTLAALTAAGCASSAYTARPGLSAEENLRRAAMVEGRRRAAEPIEAPVPPGVDAESLEPRARGDLRASLSVDEAIAEVVATVEPPPPPAAPAPLDEAMRDQALRHYAKGRDAALRNRQFQAITELEKAQALDPQSPAVLRQLARSYEAMNNSLKAAGLYEQLLLLEPDDSETLFVLGLAAATRRDFEESVSYLARPRLRGTTFDHDPAAGPLADFVLATSLRELGYDRAWIELGGSVVERVGDLFEPTMYAGRYGSLYRQRSEILRGVGDAHCRLGEYDEALATYRASSELPSADPDALHPRVMYANLRTGRVHSAQLQLLLALGEDGSSISERDIRLCRYAAEHAQPVEVLAQAVVDRQRANPDDPRLVRAAALLLPRDDAVVLLREFVESRPTDLEVLSQLLAWLAAVDERSAVELTVALAQARPDLGGRYGDRLALAAPSTAPLLAQVRALDPSPARSIVECRLLVSIGALGQAWSVCSAAVERWPSSAALHRQRITLAMQLDEPPLVEEAIAGAARFDDVDTWIERSRALRAVDEPQRALAAAATAVDLDRARADALAELARAHMAFAASARTNDDRRQQAGNAVVAARRAVEIDPHGDRGYEVMLELYGPGGLLDNRALQDDTIARLYEQNPQSRLVAKLQAQRDLQQGRLDRALERALVACESDPSDVASLELAMAVWVQSGREDAALEWLEKGLDRRPGDPGLLAQWSLLQLRRDRAQIAIDRLAALIAAEPEHDAARALLETLYRGEGRPDLAVPVAEQRLLARPQGVRRELELARVYAGAGNREAAIRLLEWILDRADTAKYDHLISAWLVVGSLSEGEPDDHRLSLAYAQRIVELHPDAPLQVYGSALRALADLGPLDERFDDLADRAARFSRGATGSSVQSAGIWRNLAQALVDSGHPEAAARAVRARLWADAPLDADAQMVLTTVALVADAASDRPEDSIELINRLAVRGKLPRVAGMEQEPSVPSVLYETSIMYSLLGSEPGAQRLLRETIRLDPDHAMALNNLGYTHLEMGFADDETAGWIARARELRPQDSNVLDTVGWLSYKRGHFEGDDKAPGAVSLIEESLKLGQLQDGDPSAEVLDHLGDAQWRLGETDQAVKAWRQATEILGNDGHRQQFQQIYEFVQAQRWFLVVAEPEEIYERQYGAVLERALEKLRNVDQGSMPDVAETFEEHHRDGADDGGS